VTGLFLVVVVLGGSCAFVWSLIVQADGAQHAALSRPRHMARRSFRSRAQPLAALSRRMVMTFAAMPARLGSVREARRRRRAERALDAAGPRQLQFDEIASFAPLLEANAEIVEDREAWSDRPSRLVAALELVVLIVLVGGVLAAATLGTARVVARLVAAHFAG
jgi:hypothetical protein